MPFNSNTNRTNLPPDVSGNLDDVDNAALTQPCVKYIKGEYWIINPIRDKQTKEIIDYQPVRPCVESDLNNNLLIPADWVPRSKVTLSQAKQDLHIQLKDYFDRKKKNNEFLEQLAKKQNEFTSKKAEPITAETSMEEFIANPNVPIDDKIANFFLLSIKVEDPENPRQKVTLREMLSRKRQQQSSNNSTNSLIDAWVQSQQTFNTANKQQNSVLPLYEDDFLHVDPSFNGTYFKAPAVTFDPAEKGKPGFVYMGKSFQSPLNCASCHEVTAPAISNDVPLPRHRTTEISEAASILSGAGRGGLLLVGDPGVGKTHIATAIGIQTKKIMENMDVVVEQYDLNVQQQINAGSGIFGEHQKKTAALKADIEYNNTGKKVFKRLYIKKYSIDMEWLESIVAQRTPLGTISAAEIVNQTLDQLADILYKAGKLPRVVTILAMDEAHNVPEAGKNGDSTSAFVDELKQWIESGLCRTILMTTLAEKAKFLKDAALKRRHTEITLQELSKEATFEILKDIVLERMAQYRDRTPFQISDSVINDILNIAEDSLPNIRRPAAPIKLLDNVISDIISKSYFQTQELVELEDKINMKKTLMKKYRPTDAEYKLAEDQIIQYKERYNIIKKELANHNKQLIKSGGVKIVKDDIYPAIAKQINLDSAYLTKHPAERKRIIEKALFENIIGHDEALEKIVNVIVAKMCPLRNQKKSPFVCMFTGVPGTGKSEIAKVISKATGQKLFTLEMNQYQSHMSESNIFGSPRGTIDSDNQTAFVAFIRANQQGIVLIDELEKAYPGIMNKFLQIFEDGFFLDNQTGEYVDCKGITFILTSNALSEQLAANPNMTQPQIIDALKSYKSSSQYGPFADSNGSSNIFSGPLMSRTRDVFGFGNLTPGQMFQLVELKLKLAKESAFERVKLTLDFGEPTKEYLQAREKYIKSISNESETEQIKKIRKWEEYNADMKYPENSIVYKLLSDIRSQNGDGRFVEKLINEKIFNKLQNIWCNSERDVYENKTVKITTEFNSNTGKWDIAISDPYPTKQPEKTAAKPAKKNIKNM